MTFFRFLVVKLLFFYLIFTSLAGYANNDRYFVKGVVAYADSSNPALSRRKASVKARKMALSKLLGEMEKDVDAKLLSNDQILDLILEERVMDEVISANSYSASFNIRFSKDFVDRFLVDLKKQQRLQDEMKKMKFLMIPILSKGGEMVIWGDENSWSKTLKKEVKRKNILNVEIIGADIHNLSIINSYNISRVSKELIDELFIKYDVDLIYLVFYSYVDREKKARLTIRGYNRSDSDEYRLAFANKKSLSQSYVQSHIAEKLIEYIKTDGLKAAVKENVDDSAIRVEIPVRRLSEWLSIEKRLQKSDFITYFEIKSISRDFVKVDLKCKDSINIVENFTNMGFDLVFRSQDVYLLIVK